MSRALARCENRHALVRDAQPDGDTVFIRIALAEVTPAQRRDGWRGGGELLHQPVSILRPGHATRLRCGLCPRDYQTDNDALLAVLADPKAKPLVLTA